jgi:hypothetical protein
MDDSRTAKSGKPYDIRERLFLFACDVIRAAKQRIALREVKEARLRLRILRATGFLDASHDALIREAQEIVLILSTIIRNNQRNELGGA